MTSAQQQLKGLGSDLERAFDTQWLSLARDLPLPVPNFEFHEGRGWKFDRAWPPHQVAVELEGGQHGRKVVCHNCGAIVRSITKGGIGGEVRAAGWHGHEGRFVSDREKYNVAALDGWLLLRFVHDDVVGDPFSMVEVIRQALENRAWKVVRSEPLTYYQMRVLHLMAGGLRSPEIAARLNMTEGSVRRQAMTIMVRLHATNRISAIARAFVLGIIDPAKIPWQWDQVTVTEGGKDE
jgi:DNA-binding CsgD family transcriptional regulator